MQEEIQVATVLGCASASAIKADELDGNKSGFAMSTVRVGEEVWFEESMGGHSAYRLKCESVLAEEVSPYQSILVFTNKMYGTVLALDGVVQCTTRDEHIYHEMMVHVPLMSKCMRKNAQGGEKECGSDRDLVVAIIGGGDGGVLREVLKYPQVKNVTLIDIDQRVIDLCKEHMPGISNGAFEDKRTTVLCQDGAEWLKTRNADIDVLIIDSSDDDETGSNSTLFNDAFYASVCKSLKESGVVVKQSGCAFLQEKVTLSTITRLRKHFPHFGVYRQNIPTYVGGDMQITWASHSSGAALGPVDPTTSAPAAQNLSVKTKYYNAQVHSGAFALPNDLLDKIKSI